MLREPIYVYPEELTVDGLYYQSNGCVYILGAKGLQVSPVYGETWDILGNTVYFIEYPEDGRVYYCAGESWPEDIVKRIIY